LKRGTELTARMFVGVALAAALAMSAGEASADQCQDQCFSESARCKANCQPDDPFMYRTCVQRCDAYLELCLRKCGAPPSPFPPPLLPDPGPPVQVGISYDNAGLRAGHFVFTSPINGKIQIGIRYVKADVFVTFGRRHPDLLHPPSSETVKPPFGFLAFPVENGVEYEYTVQGAEMKYFGLHTQPLLSKAKP
jgi:hypothetical protein